MKLTWKKLKYFRVLDGIYASYWIGKFISFFIWQGKKLKANKQILTVLVNLKLTYNIHPSLYLFEILEQARPMFQLKNCFPRRTKVVYPTIVVRSRQYTIALHWLKDEIKDFKYGNSDPFTKVAFDKLVEIRDAKKHTLFKRRDSYLSEAVLLQHHSRFSWPRA